MNKRRILIELVNFLQGPEACDFQGSSEDLTWKCDHTSRYTHMWMEKNEVTSLPIPWYNCDCEIVFNLDRLLHLDEKEHDKDGSQWRMTLNGPQWNAEKDREWQLEMAREHPRKLDVKCLSSHKEDPKYKFSVTVHDKPLMRIFTVPRSSFVTESGRGDLRKVAYDKLIEQSRVSFIGDPEDVLQQLDTAFAELT